MLTPTSLAREDNDCQCCRPFTVWDNACCVLRCFFACRKRKNHKRGTTIDVKVNRIVINVISEKNQNNSLIDNEEGVTTKTIHTERIA